MSNVPLLECLWCFETRWLSQWSAVIACNLYLLDDPCHAGVDGTVERVTDEDLKSLVLDMRGANLATTSIRCPKRANPQSSLGISLSYLVVLMKKMGEEPFSLEVQVLDSKNTKRRFRASTFQVRSSTRLNNSLDFSIVIL